MYEFLGTFLHVAACHRFVELFQKLGHVLCFAVSQMTAFQKEIVAKVCSFDHTLVNDGKRSDASQYKILEGFRASWRTVKQAYPGALQG